MKRLFAIATLLAIFVVAMAMPTFSKAFNDTYKVKKDSTLEKAKCSLCHVSAKGGKLNPYGIDMQKEMKTQKTKKLTAEVLKALEKLDSDKDKITNLDEIKKDALPGGEPKKKE